MTDEAEGAPAPDRLDVVKAKIAEILAERDRFIETYGVDRRVWFEAPDWPEFSEMLNGAILTMLDLYPEVGTVEEVKQIFEKGNYAIDEAPAGVFVISVMRRLLQDESVPFLMTQHSAFHDFADRYRKIIMG